MTRTGTIWTLTAALACATLATPARAQQLSETRIRELIKQAAERTVIGVAVDPQQPASAAPAASRPVVRLTLEEAVKLALDRNLDIAVQRLNPEISDIAVLSVKSVYNPTLTSTFGPQSTTQLPTSQLQLGTGGAAVTETVTYNGGVAQSIPWGGGSFSAALNNFRRTSTSNNSLFDPQFQSAWSFAYTQPLMRNFRIDSTRQRLQVTRLNREISDVQLRATMTNTLSNVRNAYWDYVFAVQSVDVAQRSVNLAEQLVKDNQTRVEVGTMAPIDVVQAQSQSATQRQNLVVAQGTMRAAELALKRLIVSGTADPNWNVQIDPTDRPDFRAEAIDVEAAVRRALSERTDLEIAKHNVQANDVTLKYLRDQLKPQADVAVNYVPQGVGGTQLIRSSSGTLGSSVTSTVPGGITDAFSSLFHNTYPQWTAQVNFSYPLGTSSQEANVARARVQLSQVQAQMKQIELQIATDVTNAAINVQSGAERVQAAQAARELAQKQLEAETSKFEVGMSTNYNVIQSQRDLATAQNNELQSILNYRKALVELERLQQTTLQSLNISILAAQ
ncbi:MAG: TolC family protein [Acidobacteria bacterium]|nr:TolC family protein [Acidobacteriota bacterium]